MPDQIQHWSITCTIFFYLMIKLKHYLFLYGDCTYILGGRVCMLFHKYILFNFDICCIFLTDIPAKRKTFAFYAELNKKIQNLLHDHKVVFGAVHVNEGGAYDPKTGVFTCKEPGIYVFDWKILTHSGKSFHTELMLDGASRARLHLEASSSKARSASNMVVLKLKPGNKVWIEPHRSDVGQYAYEWWSSFSGFKI